MKISVSIAAMALAATQVMAVIPTPIKECTKSVIVTIPGDGCAAFAARWNTTFDDMLKWNTKLSPVCNNLDEGHPICVSITKGDCCLGINPNVTSSGVPTSPATATTPSASSSVSVPLPSGGASSTKTNSPTVTLPPSPSKTPNGAAGVKGSMALAAAGVILSVVYML
ncbi:hypothetical protein BGZ83_008206 [Gryganskiella cystojenkinii]|nr:hypothetical protein BGZ83_008206 [Gryganskiella cystojenkinii]